MPEPFIVARNAVYDDGALRLALGLTSATLCRERREGRLRYARKGNRILYLGQWVLDWLAAAAGQKAEVAHAG